MTAPSARDHKRALRAVLMARRDLLGADDRLARDAARAPRVLTLPELAATPGIVAGYWPMRSEADPRPILTALAAQGRMLALPAVVGNELAFRAWTPGDALLPGGFGTSVPAPASAVVVPAVLLVPLLAFDRRCHRLGYGKGYYDRALATLKPKLTIGIAFDLQRVDEVPIEGHDAALDLIVTERYVLRPSATVA